MPIITYQDNTSTPSGGKFLYQPVLLRCSLISSSVLLSSWRKKIVSICIPGPPVADADAAFAGASAIALAAAEAKKGTTERNCQRRRRVSIGSPSTCAG